MTAYAIVRHGAAQDYVNLPDVFGTPGTIASLGSAATAGNGARGYVTDALAPVALAIVTAGGAVSVPVYSDGTNWRVG